MLDFTQSFATASGKLHRRSVLKAGVLGLGGMSLAGFLRAQAESAEYRSTPSRKSVILLWQQGGPSHLETYDMKPDAVRDIRGPFSPISTNVPGIDICELLPMHAAIATNLH